MPKYIIERDIPGAGELSGNELHKFRKNLALFCIIWAHKYSGWKVLLLQTKFIVSI